MIRNKFLFYFLSFTWGLPMTLIGCLVAAVLLICGCKPQKWGYCYYFEIGEKWGGLNLGPIFLVNKNASNNLKAHEGGHGLQNCIFGLLMPFIICIPSVIRYWYREIRKIIRKPCVIGYYDIWFEKQASELGNKFIDWHKKNTK
jgi:hypothetical protein